MSKLKRYRKAKSLLGTILLITAILAAVTVGAYFAWKEFFPATATTQKPDALKAYLQSKGWSTDYDLFKPMMKDCQLSDTEKQLIDYYEGLPDKLKKDPRVHEKLAEMTRDGKVSERELRLFDDEFVNPTKPSIKEFRLIPTRIVNDKIYDIRVSFKAADDKTRIIYAEANFTPVDYKYFITEYGVSPEDYEKIFPPDKKRVYILKPMNKSSNDLEEEFSIDIKNIIGGREYKINILVMDEAGNKAELHIKTPYIRQFENIAKKDNVIVCTYYYPWYSPNRHWQEGYTGTPLLGRYDSRDPIVISKQIDWATGHGIDVFIMSWWGPGSWEDKTLRDYILKNPLVKDVKILLLYESAGRLNLDRNLEEQESILYNDFSYLANTYFKNPHYFRINNNRPAVILYLARLFKGNVSNVINGLRFFLKENYYENIYLIGDIVYWQDPFSDFEKKRIRLYDAVTPYNMHTSVANILNSFEENLDQKYAQWYNVTRELGVDFIPSVLPGFNDTAVRTGNIPLPRSIDRFWKQLEIGGKYMDNNLRMIAVTTFNEWHEYTSIEPSREYGMEYLNALKEWVENRARGIVYILPSKHSTNEWTLKYGDRIYFYAYANISKYRNDINDDFSVISKYYDTVIIIIPGEDTELFYNNLATIDSIAHKNSLRIMWAIFPKWKYGPEEDYLKPGTPMNKLVLNLMKYLANLRSTWKIALWYGWENRLRADDIIIFYEALPETLKEYYAVWIDQPYASVINDLADKNPEFLVVTELYSYDAIEKYSGVLRLQMIITGYSGAQSPNEWLDGICKKLVLIKNTNSIGIWIFYDRGDGSGEEYGAYFPSQGLVNPWDCLSKGICRFCS